MGTETEVASRETEAKTRDGASRSAAHDASDREFRLATAHLLASPQASLSSAEHGPVLSHQALACPANEGMRAAALQGAQRTFGNQFVQRALAPNGARIPSDHIQRKCACGGSCANCGAEEPQLGATLAQPVSEEPRRIQAQMNRSPSTGLAPGSGIIPSGSPGEALDPATRSFMESRFVEDFTGVRIHSDTAASESSGAVGARAYTAGHDIYFASGQYSPDTGEGRQLLAHELAHVVQQRSGAAGPVSTSMAIGLPGDIFEQEAERAADAVNSEKPPEIQHPSGLKIQKKDEASPAGAGGTGSVYSIPPEKGRSAEALYKQYVAGKPLKCRGAERPSSESGETLYVAWVETRNLTDEEKKVLKKEGSRPRQAKSTDRCTVDHIIDYNLGGSSTDPSGGKNLILMGQGRNSAAGGRARGQCSTGKTFTDVRMDSVQPDDECMQIERNLKAWIKAQGGADTVFLFIIGNSQVPVPLPEGVPGAGGTAYDHGNLQLLLRGKREGTTTGGLLLQTMHLVLDDQRKVKEGTLGARFLPNLFPFQPSDPAGKPVSLVVDADGRAAFKGKEPVAAKFPFLSETVFEFETKEEEISGQATLKPSLPLLSKAVIVLKFENSKVSGGVSIPAPDIHIPIPGLKMTDGSIDISFGTGQGPVEVHGTVGFKVGSIAHGRLNASFGKEGLKGDGTLDVCIPGLDSAKGTVNYKDGKFSGRGEIETSQLKKILPVRAGKFVITVSDEAMTGSGELDLTIPGIKKATVGFSLDKSGNYAITGTATLDIPGLKSAEVGFAYIDNDFQGTAKVGLDIPGLKDAGAQFDLKYSKGALTGAGEITYKKGKLSGKVHAALSEKHRISGGGELAYEIIPGLVAGVGMEIREDGTTKISGELKIPAQINLFPEKKIEKTIFSVSVQIPIFAIPLGTRSVGLVAEIGADLKARAGIGPGQIRQLNVKAAFDPAKEESKFEFSGGGELYVPAHAEIALGVHGGIGLSVAIASATGGIELAAALGLEGALSAMVQIAYQDSRFTVDAVAELSAQPVLKFSINAYVKVDVILIGEVYRKDWNLASKEWGSGLKIGLRFPVHYEFGKPFEITLSQVEFIVPDIDYKKAVKDLLPV